jgi:hypothetical protein
MSQELQMWLQINAIAALIIGIFVAQIANAALERRVQRDSLALVSYVNMEQKSMR